MNIPGITGGLTASELRTKPPELTAQERAHAAHLRGAALRDAPAAQQGAAVASQFEAVLVRQLLGKTLTAMLGSADSAANNVYGDLLTDSFSQQLAAGPGLGLGRMLEKQLTPPATSPAAAPTEKALHA